jgi:hypothetical protein
MYRPSVRPLPAFLAGASLLTLAFGLLMNGGIVAAWPVDSSGTVSLDDFTATSKDGDLMTIKHADFEGTNLTKDEIEKILSPDAADDDKTALIQKMKVGKMSIPLIDLAMKNGGSFHIHDVEGSDIDSGKIGALAFSSFDGSGPDKGGKVAIKAGALKVANADLSTALAAATHAEGATPASQSQLGSFSWQGLDFTVPEKEGGAADKTIHIAVASIDLQNKYDGETFKDGALTVKGLAVEPANGTDFASSLGLLGYSRLDLGVTSAVHYDADAKTLAIDDISFSGDKMGSFGVKANFGGVGPEFFGASNDARMAGLMDASISALELKFINAGLFEKAVAYFAKDQNAKPEDVKKQWSDAAGQMLPAMMGGDPAALKLAAAAQKFIAAPTDLTITLKPKSGSLKFADAMALGDPMAALSKIDITASAGK